MGGMDAVGCRRQGSSSSSPPLSTRAVATRARQAAGPRGVFFGGENPARAARARRAPARPAARPAGSERAPSSTRVGAVVLTLLLRREERGVRVVLLALDRDLAVVLLERRRAVLLGRVGREHVLDRVVLACGGRVGLSVIPDAPRPRGALADAAELGRVVELLRDALGDEAEALARAKVGEPLDAVDDHVEEPDRHLEEGRRRGA